MKRIFSRSFPALIIPVIAVLCFVLLAPAFADMDKVDEAELARTNASVTGVSVKNQIVGVEKDVINPERLQVSETFNKDDGYSPSVSKAEGTGVNLNINGQTTFQFSFGPSTSNVTGGTITSFKQH